MSIVRSAFCGLSALCLVAAVDLSLSSSVEKSPFAVTPAQARQKKSASATATARGENTAINLATRKALDKFRKLYPTYRGELVTSMGGASTKSGMIQVTVTVSEP